jgi:hypothetical protein
VPYFWRHSQRTSFTPKYYNIYFSFYKVKLQIFHIKTKKINRTVIDTSKVKASKNVLKTVSKAKSESSSISKKAIDKKVNLLLVERPKFAMSQLLPFFIKYQLILLIIFSGFWHYKKHITHEISR